MFSWAGPKQNLRRVTNKIDRSVWRLTTFHRAGLYFFSIGPINNKNFGPLFFFWTREIKFKPRKASVSHTNLMPGWRSGFFPTDQSKYTMPSDPTHSPFLFIFSSRTRTFTVPFLQYAKHKTLFFLVNAENEFNRRRRFHQGRQREAQSIKIRLSIFKSWPSIPRR